MSQCVLLGYNEVVPSLIVGIQFLEQSVPEITEHFDLLFKIGEGKCLNTGDGIHTCVSFSQGHSVQYMQRL